FSFAVAKIEQKLNTNQIFTKNISQTTRQSCIHFPLSKRVTGGKKNFILLGEMGDFAGGRTRGLSGEEVRLVGMKGVREGKSSRILPYSF
ncbi:hypothetical protein, partial [uncultured Porphyromonas sp.]|uniref:hypothetical protein n=1 Tax=uncultured Porphyromonas sp. TaxID=159274 RepID=UPI002594FEE0